jgi:hypothetical protein
MKVEFMKDADGVKSLAIYLAELTRQSVEYLVDNNTDKYVVSITGY